MGRTAHITRATRETDITIRLDLDGTGHTSIDTGVPFFDHMLDAFGRHGLFDLEVHASGDIDVEAHHTVEDCGIVLGQCFAQALGDCRGIVRYGSIILPMDEALVMAAVDISGRGQLHYEVETTCPLLGTFDVTLAQEFFIALAANMGATLNIRSVTGRNMHHILEAAFKAAAKAIGAAVAINPRIADEVPSTKGVL